MTPVQTLYSDFYFTSMFISFKMVTIHDPAESLGKIPFAKVGVDSPHREVFNQKVGLPE